MRFAAEGGRGAVDHGRDRGVAPPCSCHGEPSYWHAEKRRAIGGYWRCRVRKRQADAALAMARYDRDPVYRITKHLKANARKRAERLALRKQAMIPTEGG